MLIWIVMLGIIGLALVIAEAFIPGFGIFGIAGSIALISSTVIAGIKYGFAVFLIMIAAFIILLLLFIRFAKTKKVYDKFVLNDVLNTKDFDETILQDMEGKKGMSITTIQPYGKMEVEGMQIDVCSEGVKGKTVVVKEVN